MERTILEAKSILYETCITGIHPDHGLRYVQFMYRNKSHRQGIGC